MANRIDALSDSRGPWPTRGDLLKRQLDTDLQSCVAAAAEETGAPIALVSLILQRTQFFRAHVGLPEPLRVAQATDRSSSFCQFVVRDGAPFEVTDAVTDPRIPKDLVVRYGIRSYLGVPVVADGAVVGSLCVIDTIARDFTEHERGSLAKLGQLASNRLQELAEAREPAQQRLVRHALAPAFAEVRNVLVPLKLSSSALRRLACELEPLVALLSSELSPKELQQCLAAQPGHAESIRDLSRLSEDLATTYGRLESSFNAITDAVSESPTGAPLSALVRTGLKLALHSTKLVGGVELADCSVSEKVVCTKALGAAVVSVGASALALRCTAEGGAGPLRCGIDIGGPRAVVTFSTRSGLAPRVVLAVVDELADLASGLDVLSVEAAGSSLRLLFERHP